MGNIESVDTFDNFDTFDSFVHHAWMCSDKSCFEDDSELEIEKENKKIAYIKDQNNNQFWFDQNEQLHADTGPSVNKNNTYFEYRQHGLLHRDEADGPAIYDVSTGLYIYYKNGLKHRINGPCQKNSNNDKELWFVNGKNVHSTNISEPIVDIYGKCYNCSDRLVCVNGDCIAFCTNKCLQTYCQNKNK